jgi:hypothetical protein
MIHAYVELTKAVSGCIFLGDCAQRTTQRLDQTLLVTKVATRCEDLFLPPQNSCSSSGRSFAVARPMPREVIRAVLLVSAAKKNHAATRNVRSHVKSSNSLNAPHPFTCQRSVAVPIASHRTCPAKDLPTRLLWLGGSRFIVDQTCFKRWLKHSFRHPR